MAKIFFPILLIFIGSILAGFSLLHNGLLPTHDGEYHIVRFYEFDKVLREGNIYPRWAPDLNNGYGVPLFSYVYPLPNYFGSLFHFLGFSFIDSYKLSPFSAILIGGFFFYLWSMIFWGKNGGLVSAFVYSYTPYHFVDVYVRGSIGEVWALAFFPALLWSVTKLIKDRKNMYIFSTSAFLALVIFSHNILSLMFFIFLITYILFSIALTSNKKLILKKSIISLILGLLLSSIFWLPALAEQSYVRGLTTYEISEHFVELYQLLFPSWGTGFSPNDPSTYMSLQIGIINIISILFSAITYLMFRKKIKNFSYVPFFIFWFLITIFLMLKFSQPLWDKVPLMNYFQFPWRFLSLTSVITSFLAGAAVCWRNKFLSTSFTIVFIICSVLFTFSYTKINYYLERNDSYYTENPNFIDGTNSIGNVFNTIWMNPNLKQKRLNTAKEYLAKDLKKQSEYSHLEIISDQDSDIYTNIAYFPGWVSVIDGKETKTRPDQNGLLSFYLPKGKHDVKLYFDDTPLRRVAKIFSMTSFIVLLALFVYEIKKERYE